MSLNNYAQTATLEISIEINGSGQFSPLPDSYGAKANWTLTGTVSAQDPSFNLTPKDLTCGTTTKQFRTFEVAGVGNASGEEPQSSVFPPFNPGLTQTQTVIDSGGWQVNTNPVLSSFGQVDGQPGTNRYYTVLQPLDPDAKEDDPIIINPAIDGITRVYVGDIIYASGPVGFLTWKLYPRRRLPDPKKTFLWEPNTDPTLASGGMVDGVRTKPGTIMIPLSDHYIAEPAAAIDGMRYFYKEHGIMFDGQRWNARPPQPFVYVKNDGSREFRNINAQFGYINEFDPTSNGPNAAESDCYRKQFIRSYIPIDDSNPIKFSITPDGGEEEKTDLLFRWGESNGIQPPIPIFGAIPFLENTPWGNYVTQNIAWLQERMPTSFGVNYFLKNESDVVFFLLGVNDAIYGGETVFTESIEVDGETLTNTITTTLSITPGRE